jgi:hypothetical protein
MKRHAPATARNSEPIAKVLERELPETGLVLEVASGSGEHAVYFARNFPKLEWQPSDPDRDALASVAAWRKEADIANLRPPLEIDACADRWPINCADAVLCINMIHISPWEATEGLFAGASRLLAPDAPLITYGPYIEAGVETAPSNLAFHESLIARDPRWGLRKLEDIDALAASHGFTRTARYAMPANNLSLVFRRKA